MKKLLITMGTLIGLIALNCEKSNTDPTMSPPNNGGPFTTVTRITPNGIEAGDKFATAVDATSEYTAIGSIGDDTKATDAGAVYVLQRDGLNFSNTSQVIYNDNPTEDEQFGFSVGISNSFLIVGAPYNDKFGEDAGIAFIYLLTGDNQWSLIKELSSPTPNSGDLFGYSVSIDQGLAAVGSWQDIENYYDTEFIKNAAGRAQGSVYVFDQASDWALDDILVAGMDIGHRWDNFARSLAVNGNQVVVGAPGLDNTSYDAPGRVYIFEKSSDAWVMNTFLESSEGQAQDFFGSSLDFDGSILAATAPGNYNGLLGNLNIEGAAFVFTSTSGNWSQATKLETSEISPEANFGSGGIAVHTDYVIVGAPSANTVLQQTGAAFLFERGSWEWSHYVSAQDPVGLDQFAGPLAITSDLLFVGSPRKCNSDGCLAGALYFVY